MTVPSMNGVRIDDTANPRSMARRCWGTEVAFCRVYARPRKTMPMAAMKIGIARVEKTDPKTVG